MNQPFLNQFGKRRLVGGTITLLAMVLLGGTAWLVKQRLGHASILTGATCLACLFLLMLIGVRRRIRMLPLWKMSTWVQVHLYVGLFCTAAYVFHVPKLFADGLFEGGLSLLFLGVTLSGFYGLYVSRTAPKRLTAVKGDFRYEQIGWHREQIAQLASGLIDPDSRSTAAPVLARFYRDNLFPFFRSPPSLSYVAMPGGARKRRLLSRLRELDRYLEDETRQVAGRFAALVRMRDDLDYHYALQFRLRVWLVVHSMLSIGLLVWASAHALLALQFLGS
ncbi:hypothetical protein FF011L_40880 [Roseimaritima multifibrata]|uniref:Ferric reductase like transmembrane component n=1 Tax=Roseimaritima multifibrata TaxID=1930274 RepID=A0A517MK83_9BACT|nr:hypothetical protein [Roseimaritima multifibrata]QDS95295.1 hypothetical protein FF011L_40880 [Roseimaritima multifibrata]